VVTADSESRTISVTRQHIEARYWYRFSVCPSVHPSVKLWYCDSTNTHNIKLFSLHGRKWFLNSKSVTKWHRQEPQLSGVVIYSIWE